MIRIILAYLALCYVAGVVNIACARWPRGAEKRRLPVLVAAVAISVAIAGSVWAVLLSPILVIALLWGSL